MGERSRSFCAGNHSLALVLSTILPVSVCISQMWTVREAPSRLLVSQPPSLLQGKQRARLSQSVTCPPIPSLWADQWHLRHRGLQHAADGGWGGGLGPMFTETRCPMRRLLPPACPSVLVALRNQIAAPWEDSGSLKAKGPQGFIPVLWIVQLQNARNPF